jgi:hypothetical protein
VKIKRNNILLLEVVNVRNQFLDIIHIHVIQGKTKENYHTIDSYSMLQKKRDNQKRMLQKKRQWPKEKMTNTDLHITIQETLDSRTITLVIANRE